MIKKIVITGPESSGKTTLAQQLARALDTTWVPEFARTYIEGLNRPYVETDLMTIAKGQLAQEEQLRNNADRFLICDTDLITIKIWADYKYYRCDPWILKTIEQLSYELYLLCVPDIPWTYDPQRENPNDRMQLFERYKAELEFYQKKYIELRGTKEERLQQALQQFL